VANVAEDIGIRHFADQNNNIVHWSELDRGGHVETGTSASSGPFSMPISPLRGL